MARGTKVEYNGIIFMSKFEARIAEQLDKAKVPYDYEIWSIDYALPITKAECGVCGSAEVLGRRVYTPDFYLPDQAIFLEVKGHFKPHDRKVLQIIKRDTSHDVRMVFLFDNKVTRSSKNRYSDWCTQRDIPYALGKVPGGWIK